MRLLTSRRHLMASSEFKRKEKENKQFVALLIRRKKYPRNTMKYYFFNFFFEMCNKIQIVGSEKKTIYSHELSIAQKKFIEIIN